MNALPRLLAMTAGLMLIGAAACKAPAPATTDTAGMESPIAELEAQALALAHSEGCSRPEQLRSAPVGTRPCGGPRVVITYCSVTTDSVALFNKLAELKAAEDKYNSDADFGTTCTF